jgi:hypothetical protein
VSDNYENLERQYEELRAKDRAKIEAPLRAEAEALRARLARLEAAAQVALDNIGKPDISYPAPLVVAHDALRAALDTTSQEGEEG